MNEKFAIKLDLYCAKLGFLKSKRIKTYKVTLFEVSVNAESDW